MTEEDIQLSEDGYLEEFELKVDAGQAALRIDRYLFERLFNKSRSKIQSAIRSGLILVNQKPIKPNYKVRPLDLIKIAIPRPVPIGESLKAEQIPLNIVYEDSEVLLVDKPAGLVVHPGIGNYSGTLVNGLLYYLQNEALPILEGNPLDRPGLVHRIDKDTSGLLLIAKTENAMQSLSRQFF